MENRDIYINIYNIKLIINEIIKEKIKMGKENPDIINWSIEKNKDLSKILNDLEKLIDIIEDENFE